MWACAHTSGSPISWISQWKQLFSTEINMQESCWFLLTSKWQKLAPAFIFITPCPATHYEAQQSFAANSGTAALHARWPFERSLLSLNPRVLYPASPGSLAPGSLSSSMILRFLSLYSFQVRFRIWFFPIFLRLFFIFLYSQFLLPVTSTDSSPPCSLPLCQSWHRLLTPNQGIMCLLF